MSTWSSSLSGSQLEVRNPQPVSNVSATSTERPRLNESKRSPYEIAQQVKFLHLEAEVESLLQQLQYLKQQRIAATSYEADDSRH